MPPALSDEAASDAWQEGQAVPPDPEPALSFVSINLAQVRLATDAARSQLGSAGIS